MDITQIVIALIAAIGTVCAAYFGAKKAGDVVEAKQDAKIEELQLVFQLNMNEVKEDIKRLEVKQDKHNSVLEKHYKLEQKVDDMEKLMKGA